MRPLWSSSVVVALTLLLTLATLAPNASASTYNVLHEFEALAEGARPEGRLAADASGNLYGTTTSGVSGAVFELILSSDGKYRPKVLHYFTGGSDGRVPFAGVTLDAERNVWGTTAYGGTYDGGTVYRLTPVKGGWKETTIYSFGASGDGFYPHGGLTFDKGGRIFGTTWAGGGTACSGNGCGTVFMLSRTKEGHWKESVIYAFGGLPDGENPITSLIIDAQGRLYGVTVWGGTNNLNGECSTGCGTVFMLTPPPPHGSWSKSTLYNFGASYTDGIGPSGTLSFDAAGNLYGTTELGGQNWGTVFELSKTNWSETILHSFTGSDGVQPEAGVVFDANGNLYGTTLSGGIPSCECGTIFELTKSADGNWRETPLHIFQGGRDGGKPYGEVVFDSRGRLYTTTSLGGELDQGTVLQLTPDQRGHWRKKEIFAFPSGDGAVPRSNVALDKTGNIYGTTSLGGNCDPYTYDQTYGCGTVFELTLASDGKWNRKLLHQFARHSSTDGQNPTGGLIFDQSGNLFGTTSNGGAYGAGTVFELSPQADGTWTEQILYNFHGSLDAAGPTGSLIFDAAGNLYGTTDWGGNCVQGSCYGTVFELSPSANGWTETVLYRFTGGSDGANPEAGLTFDSTGDLYGAAYDGGTAGLGTVFMLSPRNNGWVESTLYSFTGQNGDGALPSCTLVFDGSGDLYGTTSKGGLNGWSGPGTVFKLSPSGGVWKEGVIYTFKGQSDGANPTAGLVFDSSGDLYGTTQNGGDSGNFGFGQGTVFKLSLTNGNWTKTNLYSFTGGTDGANPQASLVLDGNGTVYGTASDQGFEGGVVGDGVVFSVKP
jgi:uncharacterized repeat protein (TIGR03803 family)